ncbi:unnamed protein product [Chilo suppressalis]|uniref:MYND-type domain-containing protein n=1 Tax=Chilo suppressalis TaxID=168631 RepID=A0ABN8L777_CHISP|nr:unnamed protein product [Chilo suppressalis]
MRAPAVAHAVADAGSECAIRSVVDMTCWESVGLLGPCALLASSDVRTLIEIRRAMVSIALLTTEEVLQRNGFWYYLDNLWIVKELEPFEDVKPEHVYSKPISRDFYYTKYPDIPRSESEDDNSVNLTGFKIKHSQWKSKVCIRQFVRKRTVSQQSNLNERSNSNNSLNHSKNIVSSVEVTNGKSDAKLTSRSVMNDEKIKAFFNRLIKSVPPPPEPVPDSNDNIILDTDQIKREKYFEELDLPDYADFEKNKILENPPEQNCLPTTSTLKKLKRTVSFQSNSFKDEFENHESWYESLNGISDFIGLYERESKESKEITDESSVIINEPCEMEYDGLQEALMLKTCNNSNIDRVEAVSWSEIVDYCGLSEGVLKLEDTSSRYVEEVVSQSHCADAKTTYEELDDVDDEIGYARFAIYKIHQTLKIEEGMSDSSPMRDLSEDYRKDEIGININADDNYYGHIYRLAPLCIDDSPPENELQKNSDRVLSEHELRVQRSLQKLNVPEWYRNAPAPREGFLLRKRLSDAAASATRWSGLNSKTTSLGSLGNNAQPPPPQLSPHTTSFGRWSTSRLNSNQGFLRESGCWTWPISDGLGNNAKPPPPQLSPHTTSIGRWSTSRRNSNQTSPCSSTRSSIRGTSPLCSPSARSSFSARQPYLGWRSQERLNSTPRTPHERLASSLLQQSASSKASEEIQTSIKEVTSAIVHYVSALEPANGDIDRQPSPRSSQKLYWLESSFVGTKPLESPQTPLVVSEALPPPHPRPPSSLRLDNRAAPATATAAATAYDWQDTHRSLNLGIARPSPGSTTLEDVLDSLLGLPSQPTRLPTPQPSPRKASSPYYLMGGKSPRYEQLVSSGHSSGSPASRFIGTPSEGPSSLTDPSPDRDRPGKDTVDNSITMQEPRRSRSQGHEHSRRRSEPFTQTNTPFDRRTSLDAAALRPSESKLTHHDSKTSLASLQTDNSIDDAFVKCKYPKCNSRAPLADAKRHYKTCHNCTTLYCSKECRRAHWEKHRKVCLHSRASALCRQIISAAKEDADSLHQISTIAHKGYLAVGRGVVKVFFTSPEAAEKFTTHGYQYLTEPEYVKWTALQPNEMGVELYTEVVKLCKVYNPETRIILYVAVCIISEVPTKGAVKWERQMVSRCAKLRLSKTVSVAIQEQNRRRHRRDSKGTPEDRETLILRSKLCNAGEKNAATAHKFREICFHNISNELEKRGVQLKKHFPEVYSRLAAYVDGTSDRFIPMTIYPKDVTSGKSFMCVIMPDSELDSGTPVDGKVVTIDVGEDRSRHQLSTPM